MNPFLEMRGISKLYTANRVLANNDVHFRVNAGEIHALVGENGAGKTSLMKILDGLESADSGDILLRGTPVTIHSPRDAMHLGIGMVHQHLRLISDFSVAENVTLGREPRKGAFFFNRARARKDVISLADEYGFSLDPSRLVRDLSISEMQQVEIVKVLYRNAELIILDEPTTNLTESQSDRLFDGLKRLVRNGKTVILITHKLRDVISIADRVTVMRKGKTVAEREIRNTSEEEIASLILGNEEIRSIHRESAAKGKQVYELKEISVDVRGREEPVLDKVSLDVHLGEILGMTGISGNGLAELEDVVSGLRAVSRGRIFHKGEEITLCSTRNLRKRAMAFVPSNRLFRGVSIEACVRDNFIINRPEGSSRWGVQLKKAIENFTHDLLVKFSIQTDPMLPAGYLSGGNIQKLILARELSSMNDFILFSEPTWGLDAASIAFVHGEILKLRDRGTAVLLISTDLDEILALSDRIGVIYRGKIVEIFENSENLLKEAIGRRMLGLQC